MAAKAKTGKATPGISHTFKKVAERMSVYIIVLAVGEVNERGWAEFWDGYKDGDCFAPGSVIAIYFWCKSSNLSIYLCLTYKSSVW